MLISLYVTVTLYRVDLSIQYASPRYWFGVYWAIAMLFVYPFGIPFLYYILLYKSVDDIRLVVQQESAEQIDTEIRASRSLANVSDRSVAEIREAILYNNTRRPTHDEVEYNYYVMQKEKMFINYIHLSFLYVAYEPKYWYWEVIETFRRLVFTALVVMSTTSANLNVRSICIMYAFSVVNIIYAIGGRFYHYVCYIYEVIWRIQTL